MNNVNFPSQLRKFAIELQDIGDNESLIRTAGILKRFQTWLRKLTDSSFREELGGAWSAINGLQDELKSLDQEFEKLKDKVKNGDLEGYSAQLQNISKQTLKMLDSLRDAQQGQKKVQKILWNYTKDEMKEEGFDERIRSYLPSDFDLEFSKIYRKPLKDFVWYSTLTPEMIFVNAKGETGKSAGESLVERIVNALVQAGIGNKEEMKTALESPEVRNRLFNSFREAVVNGELITVEPAEPSTKVKRTLVGQTTAHVTTAPFAVPEIGVMIQAQVGLIDLRTSLASRKKLSLKYTKNVTVVGKMAQVLKNIVKIAEEDFEEPHWDDLLKQYCDNVEDTVQDLFKSYAKFKESVSALENETEYLIKNDEYLDSDKNSIIEKSYREIYRNVHNLTLHLENVLMDIENVIQLFNLQTNQLYKNLLPIQNYYGTKERSIFSNSSINENASQIIENLYQFKDLWNNTHRDIKKIVNQSSSFFDKIWNFYHYSYSENPVIKMLETIQSIALNFGTIIDIGPVVNAIEKKFYFEPTKENQLQEIAEKLDSTYEDSHEGDLTAFEQLMGREYQGEEDPIWENFDRRQVRKDIFTTANRKHLLEKLAEQVSLQYTRLSEIELANVLREGYRKAFGSDPTTEVLAGGWAQVILEIGRPVKLPGNNIGNLKAGNDWVQAGLPYFVKDTQEFDKAGKSYTHSGAKWKAFETPVDGAVEYWKYLGRKHSVAIQWMAAGDPNSASVALAKNTYFTANIKQYASGVSRLYTEFMQKIAPKLQGLKSEPKAPPGLKPELKDWISEYSEEELEGMNKPTLPMSGQNQKIEQESDRLMQTLMASKNSILTSLVKEAVLKTVLPEQKVLITFTNTQKPVPKYALAECARVSADVLKNILGGKVSVIETPNGEHFGVYASILGNSETVFDAVTAICDSVKEAVGANKVTPIVSLGFELQEMKQIGEEDLKGFHRQAKLRGIEND